jgi:hypothetical protein
MCFDPIGRSHVMPTTLPMRAPVRPQKGIDLAWWIIGPVALAIPSAGLAAYRPMHRIPIQRYSKLWLSSLIQTLVSRNLMSLRGLANNAITSAAYLQGLLAANHGFSDDLNISANRSKRVTNAQDGVTSERSLPLDCCSRQILFGTTCSIRALQRHILQPSRQVP